MIPQNIRRKHILEAAGEILKEGVPRKNRATKYLLVLNGIGLPPKYIISLANTFANGEILPTSVFSGGRETNSFLRGLGFEVVTISPPRTDVQTASSPVRPTTQKHQATPKQKKPLTGKHTGERCTRCKRTVELMLRRLFGDVIQNHQFELGSKPDDYESPAVRENLSKIFGSLQEERGHKKFVRAAKLPKVDYFVPEPGFVLEFDESQHFTESRRIALSSYPHNLPVGFDRRKWIKLAVKLDAKDFDPPYRDEQRAWYDTLRDFLPLLANLRPTVRLYASETQWCTLNPENPADVEKFKRYLPAEILTSAPRPCEGHLVKVYHDPDPLLARIIISGDWTGDVKEARTLLHEVCNSWPGEKAVQFLCTCGGFLNFDWPTEATLSDGSGGPLSDALYGRLIHAAEAVCRELLKAGLRRSLAQHTDFLTLGVDSFKDKISFSSTQIRTPHVELVALLDLVANQYRWTGKSYPTSGQELGLLRFEDCKSHFVTTKHGEVLLLGCHDLNVFNPRGMAVTKKPWRKDIRNRLIALTQSEHPTIVLHHPHTTDSPRIWRSAWNRLVKTSRSIDAYLGTGRYWRLEGERAAIEPVLAATKKGDSIDFVVTVPDAVETPTERRVRP